MQFLMKKVSTTTDGAEPGVLKNMPDEAGMRCSARSEQLPQALPVEPFNVEFGLRTMPISHRAL